MIAVAADIRDFKARFGDVVANCKRPRAVLAGAGREAANVLKKHFRQKDRTDINKLNPARRDHYWLRMSRAVQSPIVGDSSVSVTIADPTIAQKVFGGTIVAKRVKNLAIPLSPDAYGRSPATFERETGLKLFVLKQGGTKGNTRKNILLAAARGQGIEVEYLLTPRVNQKPDPTALPDEHTLTEAILARAIAVQQRINNGQN